MKTHVIILSLAMLLCATFAPAQPATQPTTAPTFAPGMVGQNVSGLRDYSRNQVFADCLRTARWRTFDDKAEAVLDAAGNPTTDVSCWAFKGGDPSSDNGSYTFRCKGQVNKITMTASAAKVTSLAFDGTYTTATIAVDKPDGQTQLHLYFQTGGKGFTDAVLLRPGIGLVAPPTFNPRYLELLRSLNPGVLRGMEWGRTNGNPDTDWSERPSETGYQGDGASPELFVDLCNELGSHAWVNVPHLYNDASVESFARMVKSRLKKDRFVYVEWSNEVWNEAAGFGQTEYCKAQADAAIAAGDTRFTLGIDKGKRWTRGMQFGALRATQVADIWARVFDETGESNRVLNVLGGHSNNPATLRIKTQWIDKWIGPVVDHFYGLAVAPYFGSADATRADLTADSFLAGSPSPLRTQAVGLLQGPKMQDFFALCKAEGLAALAYEGGLGFQPKSSPAVTGHVRTDDRLGPVYDAYLSEWFRQGGGVFCQFVECSPWDGDSPYGMTDSLARLPTPAMRALAAVSAAHPHPAAPQPDPRDQKIKDLEKQLALSETQNAQLREDNERYSVERLKVRDQLQGIVEGIK